MSCWQKKPGAICERAAGIISPFKKIPGADGFLDQPLGVERAIKLKIGRLCWLLGLVYGAKFPVATPLKEWLSGLNARDEIAGPIHRLP